MTMRVTILSTVMGESGSLLAAGSTYTVGDQFGQELVNSGRATDTDRALAVPQTELKPYFATDPLTGAVTGLVGPGGVAIPPASWYGGGVGIGTAKRLGYCIFDILPSGNYIGVETNNGGAFGVKLIEYSGDVFAAPTRAVLSATTSTALKDTAGSALGANTSIISAKALASGAVIFVVIEATSGKYYLFRTSTDRQNVGTTSTPTDLKAVMNIGEKSAIQPAGIRFLHARSFCEATVAGSKKLLFAEYNVASGRVNGSTSDQVRVWQSTDDGVTWSILMDFNGDGTNHHLDHFHFVKQNPANGWIYFGSGDKKYQSASNPDERFILAWDGVASAPAANTAPSAYGSLAGWKYICRGELSRCGDIGFSPTFAYALLDCDTEGYDTTTTGRSSIVIDPMLQYTSRSDLPGAADNIPPILTATDGKNIYWLSFNNGTAERSLYVWASGDNGVTWRKCSAITLYKSGVVMPHTFTYDVARKKFIVAGCYSLGGVQFVSSAKGTSEGVGVTGASWVFSAGASQSDVVVLDENV